MFPRKEGILTKTNRRQGFLPHPPSRSLPVSSGDSKCGKSPFLSQFTLAGENICEASFLQYSNSGVCKWVPSIFTDSFLPEMFVYCFICPKEEEP